MWVFFLVAGCVLGIAWFMRGSVSLRMRDEYAGRDYQSEATLNQIHQNWNQSM